MKFKIGLTPNLTSSLLSWYDAHQRDLPWRDHPNPYAVLVSEIMLQQTTVAAVIPYFERWMSKYPDIEALAAAGEDEVLLQWEGLGYYSRARNLHAAAREIVENYGGKVPRDPRDLKKLPGIGDYTAAAVASIAYGVRAPALDANNIRVWSRLLASSDKRRITEVFAKVIPQARPGDFNQALMDLGSNVCTPKEADCPMCPISPWCRAFQSGKVSQYPEKRARPDTEHVEAAIGIIMNRGKVLVQRRPEGGLLAGLFEFPGGKLKNDVSAFVSECVNANKSHVIKRRSDAHTLNANTHIRESPEEAVVREVREETGLSIQVREKLGVFTHSYTRFRVKLHVFICRHKAGKVSNSRAKWVTLEELEGLAMPSVNRRIVKALEKRLNAN